MSVFFLSRVGVTWVTGNARAQIIGDIVCGLAFGYAVEVWNADITYDQRARAA